MARRCDICGKRSHIGMKVSHSHIRTKKKWLPNIQTMRARVNGEVKKIHICAACIRSGKVEKVL